MSDIRKNYEEMLSEMKKINSRLEELMEDKQVQEYLALDGRRMELEPELLNLHTDMKKEEFSKCSHIWIPVSKNVDYYEGRSDIDYGCMKCGLDQRVLSASYPEFLSVDDKIMYNYLRQHYAIHQGIKSHTLCDLDLAHAMYSKIVEYHPEIDDVTALKYFEIALDNMRNIRVTDDRKESRVKRLMLKPGFHNWGGYKN